jgi:hypothetical protein
MSAANLPIYTGVWTNLKHGAIDGLTLTLTQHTGALLVAFLAVFVQTVGTYFWHLLSIIVFRLHFRNSSDGLRLQHEAILRNSSSGTTTLLQLLSTGWAWRGKAHRPLRRSLALSSLVLLNTLAFAAAAFFSSWVTSTTSDVLLAPSPYCGDFQYWGLYESTGSNVSSIFTSQEAMNLYIKFGGWEGALITTGSQYTQRCNLAGSCATPLGRNLPKRSYRVTEDCPFGDNICALPGIELDSGLLNSLMFYGLNTKKEDQIGARIVMSCAPLKTEGYTSGWISGSNPLLDPVRSALGLTPESRAILFYYGHLLPGTYDGDDASQALNFDYLYVDGAVDAVNRSVWGYEPELSGFLLK